MASPLYTSGGQPPAPSAYAASSKSRRYNIGFLLFYGVMYVAFHTIAIRFRTATGASPWYPPAALSIAIVFWGGRRWVPWVFVAAMSVEIISGTFFIHPWLVVATSCVLMIGYGAAGLFTRRIYGTAPTTLYATLLFIVGAIMLLPLGVSLVVNCLVAIFEPKSINELQTTIARFWIGDAIGIASFVPVVVSSNLTPYLPIKPYPASKNIVFLEIISQIVVIQILLMISTQFHFPLAFSAYYLCLIPILWAAIRYHLLYAACTILITNLSLSAFFFSPTFTDALRYDLQIFMILISASGLILSAVLSELRHTQTLVRAREQRFRDMLDYASDLVSIIDDKGIILYCSPSHQHILGYGDDLVGQNAFRLIHPDDRDAILQMMTNHVAGVGNAQVARYRFRHANGSWHHLESLANQFTTELDQKQAVINSRDVTQRRRFEHAVEALASNASANRDSDFYNGIVFSLAEALQVEHVYIGLRTSNAPQAQSIAWLIHGVLQPRVIYTIDQTPCAIAFEQGMALYPDNVTELFPNDPYFKIHSTIRSYVGISFEIEFSNQTGILCIASDTPLEDTQVSVSLLMLFSQRIKAELTNAAANHRHLHLERKILESQKLESLGLLAGGIAHDVNNFLTTISGNINLALLEVAPHHPITSYLYAIDTATARAADLSRQILTYSGQGVMKLSSVALNDVINEMVSVLRVSIPAAIQIETELQVQLPRIECDALQIRQIIMNLILNAADAIKQSEQSSGSITIRTSTQWLDPQQSAVMYVSPEAMSRMYAIIQVEDTGTGMDATTLNRIFEPFFTTKPTGRGLGLAAVQGIIKGHHGLLDVQSTFHKGSTFSVYIPINGVEATNVIMPQQEDSTVQNRTVLVADKDGAIRVTIGRMIERLGYHALLAGDEETLFSIGRTIMVRVVLIDSTILDFHGDAIVQQIRTMVPQAAIMVMSAASQKVALQSLSQRSLVRGFLSKPFTLEELNTTLATITNNTKTSFATTKD